MTLRIPVFVGLVLGLFTATASAAERPIVIELFTSQGCSSCPPANAFLNEMTKGGSDVLPLAFHVTYWDRLGWKDPFSITEATLRQDRYGHRFGDGSYTPEMVVDGSVGLVGSDRDEVNAAIERAKRSQATVAGLKITRTGENCCLWVSTPSTRQGSTAAKTADGRSSKPMSSVRSAPSATGREALAPLRNARRKG